MNSKAQSRRRPPVVPQTGSLRQPGSREDDLEAPVTEHAHKVANPPVMAVLRRLGEKHSDASVHYSDVPFTISCTTSYHTKDLTRTTRQPGVASASAGWPFT